ncbi:alpha/beta hydrolase [Paenibacillus sp. SC116]|uniref:alpha/beta fold hydrolase n=1 Tax=Paenibacillus sp. SC116 TaxID=2968986 RepID=UPI00215A5F61|nr:alpha/beta hydrolase [Paenibacillus sp. SC116]MCR8842375.1 alpha/beta hydrolase [Paenibacillus sp. SC116]
MDLHYEVHGEGEPVVLVHSGAADVRDWAYITPILAKKYQVIVFDGRGCGQSPSPTVPPNYVDDLLAVLDHLNLEQATIVGHSIGGRIATDFALTYPQRVIKIVLIAPALSGFQHSEVFTKNMLDIQAASPDVDKMIEISLNNCMYRLVLASPQRKYFIDMHKFNMLKMFHWQTWESVWPQPPAIERLGELTAPTSFIIGEEDSSDLHSIAEHFQVVPNIQFVRIEDADHKPTLTHPEELSRHILEFLEDDYNRASYP